MVTGGGKRGGVGAIWFLHSSPDDPYAVYKGELVRVHVRLERGFVHEAAYGPVGQQQPVKLLTDQIRRFAPQNGRSPLQVGFEFIEGGLDLPPFVVERGQLRSGRGLGIDDGRDQPVSDRKSVV